jgi:hypothetical protein
VGNAGLLMPAGRDGPAFLVFKNYDCAYSYNGADSYALAISILSDRLKGRPGIQTRGRRTIRLSRGPSAASSSRSSRPAATMSASRTDASARRPATPSRRSSASSA